MVPIPKLTKVDEGKVCLSLLDGRRAASADSVQMRILYSPRKGVQSCLHNNIITMNFCRFSELDDTYVGHRRLLCRGGLVHMELSHIFSFFSCVNAYFF